MPTAFKLTSKQTIGGKLPKGVSFNHIAPGSTVVPADVVKTIKAQFGFDLNSNYCQTSYFIVEKLK